MTALWTIMLMDHLKSSPYRSFCKYKALLWLLLWVLLSLTTETCTFLIKKLKILSPCCSAHDRTIRSISSGNKLLASSLLIAFKSTHCSQKCWDLNLFLSPQHYMFDGNHFFRVWKILNLPWKPKACNGIHRHLKTYFRHLLKQALSTIPYNKGNRITIIF